MGGVGEGWEGQQERHVERLMILGLGGQRPQLPVRFVAGCGSCLVQQQLDRLVEVRRVERLRRGW